MFPALETTPEKSQDGARVIDDDRETRVWWLPPTVLVNISGNRTSMAAVPQFISTVWECPARIKPDRLPRPHHAAVCGCTFGKSTVRALAVFRYCTVEMRLSCN